MREFLNTHLEISGDERIYAITDNHGHALILERLLELIHQHIKQYPLKENQSARILFLGDMNDRGPDTAGVFKIMAERMGLNKKACKKHKYKIRFHGLIGNHEYGLYHFLRGPKDDADGADGKAFHNDMKHAAQQRWIHASLFWFLEGGSLKMAQSYGVISNKLAEKFELARIRINEIQQRKSKKSIRPQANPHLVQDILEMVDSLEIDFEKIRERLRDEMKRRNHIKVLHALYASAERSPIGNVPALAFLHAKSELLATVRLRDLPLESKAGMPKKANMNGQHVRIRRGKVRSMLQFHGHRSGKTIPDVTPDSIGLDSRIVATGIGVAVIIDYDQISYIDTASNAQKGKVPVVVKELGTITAEGRVITHPAFQPICISDLNLSATATLSANTTQYSYIAAPA